MSLSDFATLALAHDYPETKGRMTSPDMVVSLLTEHDSVISLQNKAKTDTKAAGFLLALNGAVTEYNLITGIAGSVGMKHQMLLTYLVYIEAVTQEFKDAIIFYANPVTYPHATATQADFAKAKGTIVYAQVTPMKGWLKITTTADCEAHRPQIYAEIQGMKRRVAGFDVVSVAGDYLSQVPREYATLFVDNAYSVIS
jgi:hypothetical protein